jgi:hypothetical protein
MDFKGNKRLRLDEDAPPYLKFTPSKVRNLLKATLMPDAPLDSSINAAHKLGESCDKFDCDICLLYTYALAAGIDTNDRMVSYVVKDKSLTIKQYFLKDLFVSGGPLHDHNPRDPSSCVNRFKAQVKSLAPHERLSCAINKNGHIANIQVIVIEKCDYCNKQFPTGLGIECGCGLTNYCSLACMDKHYDHDDDHHKIIANN